MKTARMVIDRDYTLARTDEKLFSSFVGPLGPLSWNVIRMKKGGS